MTYSELTTKATEIKANHEATAKGLDALWMCIRFNSKDWRQAKKAGAKKDSYYGWILYSTSTNSKGYELKEALSKLVLESGLNLGITCMDL
jgi:hypothetical protein